MDKIQILLMSINAKLGILIESEYGRSDSFDRVEKWSLISDNCDKKLKLLSEPPPEDE